VSASAPASPSPTSRDRRVLPHRGRRDRARRGVGPFARLRSGSRIGAAPGSAISSRPRRSPRSRRQGQSSELSRRCRDRCRANIAPAPSPATMTASTRAGRDRRRRLHRLEQRAGGAGHIGEGAIVAAGSVVTMDVAAERWSSPRAAGGETQLGEPLPPVSATRRPAQARVRDRQGQRCAGSSGFSARRR